MRRYLTSAVLSLAAAFSAHAENTPDPESVACKNHPSSILFNDNTPVMNGEVAFVRCADNLVFTYPCGTLPLLSQLSRTFTRQLEDEGNHERAAIQSANTGEYDRAHGTVCQSNLG